MTRWIKLLLFAVIFVAALWLIGPIQRNLQTSLCEDRGGTWDKASESCRPNPPK